ncbi:Gfo/Idh/MocA family protein [Planctomycetaceae bacterium SH139]
MNQSVCRWGIMGTAAIAAKNWRAIALSGNGRVSAVASRDVAAAERFILRGQRITPQIEPPAAVGSYEALLERDDVDAVYIPLPTAMRHPWVIRAAEAGKHVLCEKPIAVNEQAAREMVDACAANGVQFMDGVMFMHSNRLPAMRASIDDAAKVGKLRRISSHFMFSGDDEFQTKNIRVIRQLEPYGCLGDLGWYNVRFTLWVMGFQLPQRVTGRIITELKGEGSDGPVPGEFSGELFFADGVSASFYCSFLTATQQWAVIGGDQGYVSMEDFVLPWMGSQLSWESCQHRFDTDDDRFYMCRQGQRQAVQEYSNGAGGAQEVNMMRRFGELVLGGQPDSHWPNISLATQRVLDTLLQSAQQESCVLTVDQTPF